MASRRNERCKSCEGKIQFKTQLDAERAAASHQHKYGLWMTAYHCKFCRQYHIGHPPKNVRAAIMHRKEKRGYVE